MDYLIRNARVHDGERFLPEGTFVGVQNDRLAVVAPGESATAGKVMDASGRILAPAFIDAHNHGDLRLLSRDGANLLAQGVGTVLIGNCGFSPWGPCARHPLFLEGETAPSFASAQEYLDALDAAPLPLNAASFAGLAALLPEEEMEKRLEAALAAGCIGLSVGLNYEGQNQIGTDRLIDLGRVLSASVRDRWAGICWHMRDQADRFLASVDEVIRVHKESGVPCHINHLKRAGLEYPEEIDEALRRIEPYPQVTADMYPYVEGFTTLAFLITAGWEMIGKEAGQKEAAEAACRKFGPDAWAGVVLVGGVEERFDGKSVRDASLLLGMTEPDAFLYLHKQFPRATAMYMDQSHVSNVEKVLAMEKNLVASDGHIYSAGDPGHHPRAFGTFSRFIARWGAKEKIGPEAAIRKLTGLPAGQFRLKGRGRILPGYAADLALFSLDDVRDTATFTRRNALAEGMETVFLNGTIVFQNGRGAAKCGKWLRAGECPGSGV